jgi:hypothetical protein
MSKFPSASPGRRGGLASPTPPAAMELSRFARSVVWLFGHGRTWP